MNGYNFIELPVIDISKTLDNKAEAEEYRKIDEACRKYGAFFLSGFNSLSLLNLNGIFSEASHFFDLDLSIKNRYVASTNNHHLGYRGIGCVFH